MYVICITHRILLFVNFNKMRVPDSVIETRCLVHHLFVNFNLDLFHHSNKNIVLIQKNKLNKLTYNLILNF